MASKIKRDDELNQQYEDNQRVEDAASANDYDKQLSDMAATPYFSTPAPTPLTDGSLLNQFMSRPVADRVSGELPAAEKDTPEQAVRKYVASKAQAKTPAVPLMPGAPAPQTSDNTDDALINAQNNASKGQLVANLGAAFDQIGRGIAGSKQPVDDSYYTDLGKQAQAPVTNLLQQHDQQQKQHDYAEKLKLEDPANPQNVAFRNALFSAMPELKKQPGMESITLANPGPFEKIAQIKLAGEAKKYAAEQAASSRQMMLDSRQGMLQDRLDNSNHQRVVTRLANDKLMRDRLVQDQNLDNAATQVMKTDNLTPQAMQEFQQAVRSNLGIKGQSGVDERTHTYFRSLGWNAADMMQFLTGDPANLMKDSNMVKHVMNLAAVEKQSIQKQMNQRLSVLSGGNASMYQRRPDLKSDLDSLIAAHQGQMSSPAALQQAAATGSPPTTSPQQPNSTPATKPKTVTQNGHTYTLNPSTGQYE